MNASLKTFPILIIKPKESRGKWNGTSDVFLTDVESRKKVQTDVQRTATAWLARLI